MKFEITEFEIVALATFLQYSYQIIIDLEKLPKIFKMFDRNDKVKVYIYLDNNLYFENTYSLWYVIEIGKFNLDINPTGCKIIYEI